MNVIKLIKPFFEIEIVKIIDNSPSFVNSLEELKNLDFNFDSKFFIRRRLKEND